jgi:tryptophan-rich sensory protein
MTPPFPPFKQAIGFVAWLLLTFSAAAIGAFASAQAGTFYMQLLRPAWAPPAWLFGPVWSVLYLLMAISAWLVWRAHGCRGAGVALGLFVAQLGANALWTWLFFVWHQGAWALAEILLLWVLIVGTMVAFWPRQKIAALMLTPYWVWVSFASALTYAMWTLNPAVLG